MRNLIEIKEYPVKNVLTELLKDKTTNRNIIFATNAYSSFNLDVQSQITEDLLVGSDALIIQPRVLKNYEEQSERTRKKAEVFTPSWICNKMNNHCDAEWFGREDVFNTEKEHKWIINPEKIMFHKANDWHTYVDSKRLEITCGEAPYIVSRYDTTTGDKIPIRERIGILDRKLRIVNENTDNEKDWLKWVYRAFQSVYGYEFQGDNLLIARINLLTTFTEYIGDRWNRKASENELKKITNIIVWNLWQMDGITGVVPFGRPKEEYHQMSFFDYLHGTKDTEQGEVECKIFDWRRNESITFRSIKEGM